MPTLVVPLGAIFTCKFSIFILKENAEYYGWILSQLFIFFPKIAFACSPEPQAVPDTQPPKSKKSKSKSVISPSKGTCYTIKSYVYFKLSLACFSHNLIRTWLVKTDFQDKCSYFLLLQVT